MRVAFISDIHANYPALEAVWSDIEKRGVDDVICAGDLVSFGPHPAEVVDFFIEKQIKTVMGNHDAVAVGRAHPDDFEYPKEEERIYIHDSSARTKIELQQRHLDYLDTLPMEIVLPEISAIVTHCVPDMFHYPTANSANNYMYGREQRFLFVGHTHFVQVFKLEKEKMAINIPGVGKPKHGDYLAGYCIAEIENEKLYSMEFHFCDYDKESVCNEIIEKGYPLQTLKFLQHEM